MNGSTEVTDLTFPGSSEAERTCMGVPVDRVTNHE